MTLKSPRPPPPLRPSAATVASTPERGRPFCALGTPGNAAELDAAVVAAAGDSRFALAAAPPTVCMKRKERYVNTFSCIFGKAVKTCTHDLGKSSSESYWYALFFTHFQSWDEDLWLHRGEDWGSATVTSRPQRCWPRPHRATVSVVASLVAKLGIGPRERRRQRRRQQRRQRLHSLAPSQASQSATDLREGYDIMIVLEKHTESPKIFSRIPE